MRPTNALLVRLTLFTRANCGLCETAKHTLRQLQRRKPFSYSEIDIMAPEHKTWKGVYEFDVPVLHVEKTPSPADASKGTVSDATKLFHRFTEQEVEQAMDRTDATKSG
jgi:glutaredoxin